MPDTKTCGSELARESGGSACINAECATAFAGKPAPTLLGLHQVKKPGLPVGSPADASFSAASTGQSPPPATGSSRG
nr:hypothetical protein C1892_02345 [Pseudomonas sp. MPBD7-1]